MERYNSLWNFGLTAASRSKWKQAWQTLLLKRIGEHRVCDESVKSLWRVCEFWDVRHGVQSLSHLVALAINDNGLRPVLPVAWVSTGPDRVVPSGEASGGITWDLKPLETFGDVGSVVPKLSTACCRPTCRCRRPTSRSCQVVSIDSSLIHNPWRIHGAGILMLTWLGFLLMGSMEHHICHNYMDPSWAMIINDINVRPPSYVCWFRFAPATIVISTINIHKP